MRHRKTERCSVDRARIGGGLLIGALASGALAAGALSTAGQAQASCVSAGGWFSIGSGCTTTNPGDFALAIGPGATATASGGANTAISWGVGASASATGVHNTAIAIGNAATGGDAGDPRALARSTNTVAVAGSQPYNLAADGTQTVQTNNTAIAIGNGAQSFAGGVHSTAISNGTQANATAQGVRNLAYARGTQASARALGGSDNTAIAIGNPVDTPDTRAIAAGPTSRPTQAYAGDVSEIVAGGKANIVDQTTQSSHNTAIALGNGAIAAAGNGNDNYARAVGVRSAAGAFGGNRNRAVVLGNDSTAVAGGRPISGAEEAVAKAEPQTSDGNTAVVVGSNSRAQAGPGNGNRARVFGNNSSARATGVRQRVTAIGNDVHKPADDAAQK